MLIETVRQIRAVCPDNIPLTVRFSCTDWIEGGWTGDDSVELARQLIDEGVDLIDCSTGGLAPQQKVPTGAGYQVQFAEAIRRETGMPTAAVGLITEPTHADAIIRSGQADLVYLGTRAAARPLLGDPRGANARPNRAGSAAVRPRLLAFSVGAHLGGLVRKLSSALYRWRLKPPAREKLSDPLKGSPFDLRLSRPFSGRRIPVAEGLIPRRRVFGHGTMCVPFLVLRVIAPLR